MTSKVSHNLRVSVIVGVSTVHVSLRSMSLGGNVRGYSHSNKLGTSPSVFFSDSSDQTSFKVQNPMRVPAYFLGVMKDQDGV